MRIRIRWTETATYEVELETEQTLAQLEEFGGDGEGHWFQEMDNACPDWFKTNCVEINGRELDEIEVLAP